MLSRYDPSSGFVYIPTGNQSGKGSWHPSSRDAAPPNELCFVSEPATGHHFQEVPLDDRWHPQRSAHTAWAPSPLPTAGLSSGTDTESCCPMHMQQQKFVFKTVV